MGKLGNLGTSQVIFTAMIGEVGKCMQNTFGRP